MTTKDISEIAGVSTDTVIKKAKEYYPERFQPRKKTIFTQKEGIRILSELRKRGFVELPQNTAELPQNTEDRLTRLENMLENIITVLSLQVSQNQSVKQIEAPKIKSRDYISKLVRDYSSKNHIDYSIAWTELYTEFSYRTNSNPRTSAKNRGMSIIDYIETEGMIDTLLSIAKEVL